MGRCPSFMFATAWEAAVLLLAISTCAAAQEPVGTVVGLYHFDEVAEGRAPDASCIDNAAMLGLRGVMDASAPKPTADGKVGGALEFDGVDDVATVPHHDALAFRQGLAVEAWVFQIKRTPYARVLDKASCFDLYIRGDGIPTFRFRGAEAHGVRGTKPVPLREWVHLSASYDGQTMALHVNGKEVARRAYREPIPAGTFAATQALCIGNCRFSRPFCGRIDEVKITHLGYTPPAVTRLEADVHTVGLWRLDSEGTAQDAGPNGLHGSIEGGRPVRGKLGQAIAFDGKGAVRVPHHRLLDLRDELAIECWVKQTKRTPYARIIEKDSWVYGLWVNTDGTLDFIYTPDPEGYSHTMTMDALPLHRWVHLRAEFDGIETAIYMDGRELARLAVSQAKRRIKVSDGDLFIGNRKAGDRGFVGAIDEVRLSRRTRTPRPKLSAKVVTYPSLQRWRLIADARGVRDKAVRVDAALRADGSDRVLRSLRLPLERGLGETEFDARSLPPARYAFALSALDAQGGVVAEHTHHVNKPPKPVWLGAQTGVSQDVLPPWTPMQTSVDRDRVAVACWGRTHTFDRSPWPTQIRSAGADLLAEPVRVVAELAGRRMSLGGRGEQAKGHIAVDAAAAHEVCLKGAAATPIASVTASVTIEYDGMMRFDTELSAKAPLDAAYIEIPLAAAHASLIHRPGRWFREPTCAGALPKDGWSEPYTWYLWLGDEDRGLCWFAEDQPAWGLDPRRAGIEVVPDGEVVRLRVHLIHTKASGDGRRSFTWGLMATPVKPMPKGWQKWRFGSPRGPVNVGVLWSTLDTSKWHSFPVPPDAKRYLGYYAKARVEGKRIVPYTNFNMQSDTGDEWAYWGEDWSGHAGLGTCADVLAMNVVNVRCCAMTPSWCDFISYKYKTFLEEFDSDGFYLDNSVPATCKNPLHPAAHHNRRHIFAARDLMRRFYTVTKQNDPANVMVCHMSRMVSIPVLSFCDAIVDGEQYGFLLQDNFDGHYMPVTPPDRVRAEFLGVQWGLIPLMLPQFRRPEIRTPALVREMAAVFVPHGTRFWLSGSRFQEPLRRTLDVLDAFDIDGARFVPYWRVPAWRKLAEERKLLASAYVRGEVEAMLIVSSYAEQAQELSLDLSPLGLRGRPSKASDPLDGLPVSVRDGVVGLSVKPRDLRVVVLR